MSNTPGTSEGTEAAVEMSSLTANSAAVDASKDDVEASNSIEKGAGAGRSTKELYSDTRSFGWEAVVGILLGCGVVFLLEMGVGVVLTLVWHGFDPISQVCECPENAADFGADAVFYEGCVNTESAWFKSHNAVPANKVMFRYG